MTNKFKNTVLSELKLNITIENPLGDRIQGHWANTLEVVEVNTKQGARVFAFFSNQQGITALVFADGCLLFQKNFNIVYSLKKDITCIYAKQISSENGISLLLFLGFLNGILDIYILNEKEGVTNFKKIGAIKSVIEQPITDICCISNDLIIGQTKAVQIFRNCIRSCEAIFKEMSQNKQEKVEKISHLQRQILPISKINDKPLHLAAGRDCLYIFSEVYGAIYFKPPFIKESGNIIDSTVGLCQMEGEDLFLASTQDHIKIIYNQQNYIERYIGFKNYPSAICVRKGVDREEVWVGDLNGCLTCFTRALNYKSNKEGDTNSGLRMVEQKVQKTQQIITSGIKKLAITTFLLAVLDCDRNITFFDIIS